MIASATRCLTFPYFVVMKSIFTVSFFLKVIVAAILLQTLYFKFTGAPESIYIFETVGMDAVHFEDCHITECDLEN